VVQIKSDFASNVGRSGDRGAVDRREGWGLIDALRQEPASRQACFLCIECGAQWYEVEIGSIRKMLARAADTGHSNAGCSAIKYQSLERSGDRGAVDRREGRGIASSLLLYYSQA